ncbi:TetR/AcrR family transcriptional regulator [Roseateles sp.]|uniref:TetR/AcrR family transcriptional regulator n=1 Tax=Roseateles sp. TaxID=1971397 RepID=UPI0032631899
MSTLPVRPLPPRPAAKRARLAAPKKAARRNSLTPEAWVDAATEVLVDQGIDHVRVDVLATQLQVTRGSFYWHFRDREDLLRRVLQAWSHRSTALLTARLATARNDPQEQLRDVISLPFRGRAAQRAARIELAIRAWARRDPLAQAALAASDAARLAYHAAIFCALGFDGDEARARAFMLYSYEVSESLLGGQGSPADKLARREFMERLAQQRLGQ